MAARRAAGEEIAPIQPEPTCSSPPAAGGAPPAGLARHHYDQIGVNDGRDLQQVLKIVQRVDGAWKIGCPVLTQGAIEQASCPLIEADAEARVLWMNPQARERLPGHGGLAVAAGRLRARRRERGPALRAALHRAFEVIESQRPLTVVAEQAWAVPLGEGEAGVPRFCWVLVEDGRALVSFDDAETIARPIAGAAEVYGLSPAQVRLARAIVDGRDLAAASGELGVSVNTLRTQLQRVFDKTGVRSQAALVRALLGAEVPAR